VQVFKTHGLRSYESQHGTGGAEGCFPPGRVLRAHQHLGARAGLASAGTGQLHCGRERPAAAGTTAQACSGSRSFWGSLFAGWSPLCANICVLAASWSKLAKRS